MSDQREPPRFAHIDGVVTSFDEAAGHGIVGTGAGDELFFHCTRIADGSRTIPVGARVEVNVAPIGAGSWEAIDVRILSRP